MRFGPYELDRSQRELRLEGRVVRLPPQPFKLLTLLVGRAGSIVSREEIRTELWGDDTFVDFEHGINYCIQQIRAALEDDAEEPRYVETVPKVGYRFREAVHRDEKLDDVSPEPPHSVPKGERLAWTLTLLGAIALTAIVVWSLSRSNTTRPGMTRFSLTLPPGHTIRGPSGRLIALSSDGRRLAYVADRELYLRAMDDEATTRLGYVGTSPFFSPDGQWLGFWGEGQLKKVRLDGGAPMNLFEMQNPWGASFGPDGSIVFADGPAGVIAVPADGGPMEVLVSVDGKNGEWAGTPQILPDGETILFTLGKGTNRPESERIAVQSMVSGERRILIERGRDARYLPSGHLLYSLDDSVLAMRFDLERLKVASGPVPVLEGVRHGLLVTHYAVSGNGTLVYVPESTQPSNSLVWVDRDGTETPFLEPRRHYQGPRLSPDGTRLLVTVGPTPREQDLWWTEVDRGVLSRLTFEGAHRAVWSADGTRVIFASHRSGDDQWNLFSKSVEGGEPAAPLTSGLFRMPTSVSTENVLVFIERRGTTNWDLGFLPFRDDGAPEPKVLLATPFDELQGIVSPNGTWIAYTSNESGRQEVYVQSFPNLGSKRQVSSDGGSEPMWSPRGDELFYRHDGKMYAVPVSVGARFEAESPRVLFADDYERLDGPPMTNYAVTPDARRFVMVRTETPPFETEPRIHVVLHWQEELERRVPASK